MRNKAVCKGFSKIPVYSYKSLDTFQDDLTDNGCHNVYESYEKRRDNDSVYSNFTYLRDDLRSVFKEELNLTDL